MVQGAPLQRDHMTQPPHPSPDLHSSHTTVQVGRPSHLQSAFMAQHHNAGWSQHEEGPPKRYAPPLASNDFGSNPRPQSLSVYPPDNASQWYGGGGGNVMQPNQSLYHRGSQSSFTSQHHNAGWSHYGEGSLKRSASFSSIKMLNDFGSNCTSYF